MSKTKKGYTLYAFSGLVTRFTCDETKDSSFIFVPNLGTWRNQGEIELASPGGNLRLRKKAIELLKRRKKGVSAEFIRSNGDARFFAPSSQKTRILDLLGEADSDLYRGSLIDEVRRELAEEFSLDEYQNVPDLVRTITGASIKKLQPILSPKQVSRIKLNLVRTKTRIPRHRRNYKRRTASLYRYIFVCHANVPTKKMFRQLVNHPLTLALSKDQVLDSALNQGRNVSIRFGY